MAKHSVTAIRFHRDALEWVTLRPGKTGYELAASKEAPIEVPEGEVTVAPEHLPSGIQPIASELEGELTIVVQAEQVLMRVVELPTADPEELAGMVELQVDKFSPFAIDRLAISYEVLHETEESSRLLIVAVRQDLIDKFNDSFREARLQPYHVDVDVLGWWALLKEHHEVPESGRHVLLILDGAMVHLIVIQDGLPVLFRCLGAHVDLEGAAFAEEIVEEINYTMTTLEAEWGMAHGLDFVVWHKGHPPEVLIAKLRETCGNDIKTQNTDSLPPVTESVARRSIEAREKIIDLAPPTWRTEIFAGRAKKKFYVATAAFLVAWLIAVSAFFIVLKTQGSEIASLQKLAQNLEGPAMAVRQKKSKIRGLQLYADRSQSALECLREVSAKLPPGVDLTQFNFKKAGGVVLRGEAPSQNPIYDLFEALEQSELFIEITERQVATQTKQGRPVSNFKVTAKLTESES